MKRFLYILAFILFPLAATAREEICLDSSGKFFLPSQDCGKHIELRIDGQISGSDIVCNGVCVGKEQQGAFSSVYDLTPYLTFGAENSISVNGQAQNYPDLTLIKTNPCYFPQYGISIQSNWGQVWVSAKVTNSSLLSDKEKILSVWFEISGPDGDLLASSDRKIITLESYQEEELKAQMTLGVPHMWDFDDPYMYTLRAYIFDGKEIVDKQDVKFGIRDLVFHPSRGFLLNNRRVEIVGANLGKELCGIGAELSYSELSARLQKVRDCGFNTVRIPDLPARPYILEICDRIGLLAIDELTIDGASEYQTALMQKMIRRDMNHPSVLLWSLNGLPVSNQVYHIMARKAKNLDGFRETIYPEQTGFNLNLSLNQKGENLIKMWQKYSTDKQCCGFFLSDMFDSKGEADDDAYFIKAIATNYKFLHLCTPVNNVVTVYGNCDQIELRSGLKSYGKRSARNGQALQWNVNPGTKKIVARGYIAGKKVFEEEYPPKPAKK